MLDADTKRQIDTLRDILVGKIPNPQSQVEQITTGLIYKFMDDMDQEAVELGGEKSFFTGDYEKYAWKNLFDPKVGGLEKVKLYSEAVESMYLNPTAPQLFREIFKNAFLPFKDSSTLNMFLKEIDEFHYSHSEKLGDAFEYLLSFMGSQGDAGQFRTPRHIIDFIVEIVDPQKHESILDPACGTAGFLISSYKHILNTNTDKKIGDKLSAEDRKKIGDNLSGYDISPEMIRLSLVNMYLNGFQTPKIEEYDTLSSEDKWNEYFDVILANPPFFSPKGGIQPHKRFGVESKKAEVLFTSYILEHLKPEGRAGIIIPEGIIFQTGKAYKELRKQLIENALIGVISLPPGVFNPYSGVKTSILILDKKLNKERDSVFFAEVKNDGFSLGAQRTPISENDLPDVVSKILPFTEDKDCDLHIATKKDVLTNKDVSLNASAYKIMELTNSNYEMVNLGNKDLFEVLSGGTPKSNEDSYWIGEVNWISLVDLPATDFITQIRNSERTITELGLKNSSAKMIPVNSVIVSTRATIGRVGINRIPLSTNQGFKNIVIKDDSRISCEYLAYMMKNLTYRMIELASGGTFKEISKTNFETLSIPLPPLEVQQEIVDELEGYQKIIDGCKQVVENYKPTIDIDPSWEMVELGEVYESNLDSKRIPITKSDREEGDIPYYGASGIVDYVKDFIFDEELLLVSEDGANLKDRNYPIAFSISGKSWVNNHAHVLKFGSYENQKFIEFYLNNISLEPYITGAAQPKVNQSALNSIKVPNPSMNIQKEIVQKIEEERRVIEGNKKLIEIYTQKIQDRINKVWGED